MIYSCQIFGQNHSSHINKIGRLQNRALRIINFEDHQADANPLYKREGILKLSDYVKTQNILL